MPRLAAAQAFIIAADCPSGTARPARRAEAASPAISAVRLVEWRSMSRRISASGALLWRASTVPEGVPVITAGRGSAIPCARAKVASTSPA